VEEEKVKSALEIALEKISGLPRLTPEEVAAQKEMEYRPAGEAICRKYLEGTITCDALPAELARYPGEQIVRRALIEGLCRSMQLEDARKAFMALAGMAAIKTNKSGLVEAGEELRRIIGDFEREQQEKSAGFLTLEKQQLSSLGISGTAVRPNLNESEKLQQELAGIRRSYEPRLEGLRNMLLRGEH